MNTLTEFISVLINVREKFTIDAIARSIKKVLTEEEVALLIERLSV